MPFIHGRHTAVWFGGADHSTLFRSLDFAIDFDTADKTTFKAEWKEYAVGVAAAVATLEGLYDPDRTPDLEATILAEPGEILTLGPGSLDAVGDRARLIVIRDTAYAEAPPVGDMVSFTFAILADGIAGLGVVLHPMAQEDQDDDGATHTGPVGGTANGAIAHLHVAAVSTDDEIDVLIEGSTNGSDWNPITGGAFETADAPGAQRLVIPGSIPRYLRASWDIEGSGDQEVTFGVAIARL